MNNYGWMIWSGVLLTGVVLLWQAWFARRVHRLAHHNDQQSFADLSENR